MVLERELAKTRNGIVDLERYLKQSHEESNDAKTTAEKAKKELVDLKKDLNELNDKARIKNEVERLEEEIGENRNHLKLKTSGSSFLVILTPSIYLPRSGNLHKVISRIWTTFVSQR